VPTHEELPRFLRDWQRLGPQQRRAFLDALTLFISGLANQSFAAQLRVKRVQGEAGVWEITWAPDGRATFAYGPDVLAGQPQSFGGGSEPTTSSVGRSYGCSAVVAEADVPVWSPAPSSVGLAARFRANKKVALCRTFRRWS
jgi:hypothetical protein